MTLRKIAIALGTALAAAGLSFGAAAQTKPAIRIGAIMPMTGFGATYGDLFYTGIAMGVDDVNEKGGVNGSKIEIKLEDDQLSAQQSVLLFRKLVSDNVVAVIGPVSGTSWENVAPIANTLKTPALNFTAIKPGVTVKPYALRTAPAADTSVPDGVKEFVTRYPDIKRIVITGDVQEASGAAGIEEFTKAAKANGLTILDTVEYQTRTTDFAPVVAKIRSHDPQAVFSCSLVPTTLPLVKEMETQGFDKPLLDCGLVGAGNFIHAVGSAGKIVHSMGFATNEPDASNPARAPYVAAYLKRSAETTKLPQPANVSNTNLGYDAVHIVAQIMTQKGIDGTTDPAKAREAIKDGLAELKEYRGVSVIRMLPSGDARILNHLLIADWQNKVWKYGLPAEQRLKFE
jgi:branched-chain amino acid transport system substrate-binding protein